LDKLFDLQEKFRRPTNTKTRSSTFLYEAVNLSTKQDPKNINLGKNFTTIKKSTFMKLFREFKDVFTWTYEDLKTYDTKIIQHVIALKENAKPFQQKLRKMHPSLKPLVKKELNKLLVAKIIFPVWHNTWVENLLPVRKKSGYIRICIDFINLNRASLKDNYPVPTMEQILQSVSIFAMLSLLDGFSGYNQVLVSKEDHLKTTFQTKWGTYAYDKMPFRLINVGSTFQWLMDIAFKGLLNKSVVVYLDDITVYTKIREEHIPHLKAIFERCWWYKIYLNPKKSIFAMEEGTLLGFVISPEGITIDPRRVEAIKAIVLPHNKKAMQSFLGKINFVRSFISDFAKIVKPLHEMIKKDSNFKWTKERKEAFEKIKEAIAEAPTLWSPNFDNEFVLYTFSYDHSIVVVLTQKNKDGEEFPVSFMSTGLQGAELKYLAIDKQAFAVFKVVKHFLPYLLRSHTRVIVPHTMVRALLIQKAPGDRRGN
jgi:hypothetical protein